jgi:uncharacterized RDD family membrane protein YckC
MDNNNPFAPPRAEVADVAVAGPALAGRGNRLLAALIDVVIQLVAFFGLAWLLGLDAFDTQAGMGKQVLLGLFGLLLFLLIQGPLLVSQGQTWGKKALGIRIVRSDGSRASPGRVLGLRYALGGVIATVPFVGNLYALIDSLLIFRASRKCLHDDIADTIVVTA